MKSEYKSYSIQRERGTVMTESGYWLVTKAAEWVESASMEKKPDFKGLKSDYGEEVIANIIWVFLTCL